MIRDMKTQPIRVPYALAVFGAPERKAVAEVLKTPMIVPGKRVREFEQKIADLFGKRFGVMVNSGSSANLLAFELLDLPRCSEVITPALTFSTTLAPIIQKGLVPVFCDVVAGEYTADIKDIERLISKKTKALMIPSLIGNIPDYKKLRALAKKHHLYLIEDSCDTLGAKLYGKPTGTFSDITTSSFYASHIITAGGTGGIICVNDREWQQRLKVLAGWGRASAINESESVRERFAGRIGGFPYDRKFLFNDIGYNFQSTEISGAFGLAQLERFKGFYAKRQRNFKRLLGFFKQYERFFVLPEQHKEVDTAWLAFPLVVKGDAPFRREALVEFLEEHNIQTRPIFTGNVLRQPAFRSIKRRTRKGGYPVADLVMRGSLLIGCHNGLTDAMLQHLFMTFESFMQKYRLR